MSNDTHEFSENRRGDVGRKRDRKKIQTDLRIRFVQLTGNVVGDLIPRDEFLSLKGMRGGELWVPGSFGQNVRSESEMIGTWHWKGTYDKDVTISILLFSNGRLKLSLGTGNWNVRRLRLQFEECDSIDEIYKWTCSFLVKKLCGRAVRDWKIHLVSADKRYTNPFGGFRTESLVKLWMDSDLFEGRVIAPFTFERGRISAIRGYIDNKKTISLDHRGNVHFTGFSSIDDLCTWETRFDEFMHTMK